MRPNLTKRDLNIFSETIAPISTKLGKYSPCVVPILKYVLLA